MTDIIFSRLDTANFNINSLDNFVRRQVAEEVWVLQDEELVLKTNNPVVIWDWDLNKRRAMAKIIADGIAGNGFAYGAFSGGEIVGYIYISCDFWGISHQYARLKLFHVSAPFRGKGIGKKLFMLGCEEARERGAEKLYISANNSKESQAAYRRLGCVPADEIDSKSVQEEPFDIQMEYNL